MPVPQLGTTPELQGMVMDWMEAFLLEEPGHGFDLIPIAPGEVQGALERGDVQLVITAGDAPADGFVTPLGEEAIAIIVHKENPLDDVSLETLQALFSGRLRSWEEMTEFSEPLRLVIPMMGDAVRTRFALAVLGGLQFSPEATLAATPRSSLEQVRDMEGSIGFLPLSQASAGVKILQVESVAPGGSIAESDRYPLQLHIVAIAQQEPQGVLRDFLLWIQEKQG